MKKLEDLPRKYDELDEQTKFAVEFKFDDSRCVLSKISGPNCGVGIMNWLDTFVSLQVKDKQADTAVAIRVVSYDELLKTETYGTGTLGVGGGEIYN